MLVSRLPIISTHTCSDIPDSSQCIIDRSKMDFFSCWTRFPLGSDLLQQRKGAEVMFQLKLSEIVWRCGHKLPFPKIWKLPINTKILPASYTLWLLLCLWKGQFGKTWNFQRKGLMGSGAWGGIRSQTTFQSALAHLCLSLCSSRCK